MPKFRSMKIETPQIATNLLKDPNKYITPIGNFLRSSSLDEIPQLLSIIKGEMSFVGPRPALFNQKNLIKMREKERLETLKPGLTGWAQINGRDEISDEEKVSHDKYYKNNLSLSLDIKIIFLSFFKVLRKDGINH